VENVWIPDEVGNIGIRVSGQQSSAPYGLQVEPSGALDLQSAETVYSADGDR